MGPALRIATIGLAAALLWSSSVALATDDVAALLADYESEVGRSDDAGYALQQTILGRLADLRTEDARKALGDLLVRHGRADRRRTALILGALVRHGAPKDVETTIQWVERTRDPLLLELLHRILSDVRGSAARKWLRTDALTKATPRVKVQLVMALGRSGDPSVAVHLVRFLRVENLDLRLEALEALGRLKATAALGLIQVFLSDHEPHMRAASARALGMMGDARALSALRKALRDEHPRVVESVALALGEIGEPQVIPDLIAGLEKVHEEDLRLADAFIQALEAISGKTIGEDPELWRSWWNAVKDKPFVRGSDRPGRKTVPGIRYHTLPVRSSRLSFVLDVSRSMGWNERLAAAQEEIIKVLELLPPKTRFNVILYSDGAWAWKKRLTAATASNIRRAAAFVRAARPINGTNTHAALEQAFQDDEVDSIFVLTDGHPSVGSVTDPELILLEVRRWNRYRRVRIHAVTLLRGEPPAAYAGRENPDRAIKFMQDLAEQNAGLFKLVR